MTFWRYSETLKSWHSRNIPSYSVWIWMRATSAESLWIISASHTWVRAFPFSMATSTVLWHSCPRTAQREFNPDVKLPGVWQEKDLLEIHKEAASKTTFTQHLSASYTGSHCTGKSCDKWPCSFLHIAVRRVYLAASWPPLMKGSYQWPRGMFRQFPDFFCYCFPLRRSEKRKKVALMGSDNSQLRPFLSVKEGKRPGRAFRSADVQPQEFTLMSLLVPSRRVNLQSSSDAVATPILPEPFLRSQLCPEALITPNLGFHAAPAALLTSV